MVSAMNVSLSGLTAASKRIEVAANNIANQNSTKKLKDGQVADEPYTPQRVDLVSLSNAGVQAQVKDVQPATTQQPDSDGKLQEVPNVDQAQQLVDMNVASYDYKANIKALKVQDKVQQSLLNILS